MRSRLLPALAVLGLTVMTARSAHAQKDPATVRILKSEGTPQQKASYQSISSRFQAKAADTAFLNQLDRAVTKRDIAGARAQLANVAQVPASDIFLAKGVAVGAAPSTGGTPFMFASTRREPEPAAAMFYLLFTVGKYYVCIGDKATCEATLKALGATILV